MNLFKCSHITVILIARVKNNSKTKLKRVYPQGRIDVPSKYHGNLLIFVVAVVSKWTLSKMEEVDPLGRMNVLRKLDYI